MTDKKITPISDHPDFKEPEAFIDNTDMFEGADTPDNLGEPTVPYDGVEDFVAVRQYRVTVSHNDETGTSIDVDGNPTLDEVDVLLHRAHRDLKNQMTAQAVLTLMHATAKRGQR